MFPQVDEDKISYLLDLLNGRMQQVVSICLDTNPKTLISVFKFAKMKIRVKKVTVKSNAILRDALTHSKVHQMT